VKLLDLICSGLLLLEMQPHKKIGKQFMRMALGLVAVWLSTNTSAHLFRCADVFAPTVIYELSVDRNVPPNMTQNFRRQSADY
jgi:hypothetical protein